MMVYDTKGIRILIGREMVWMWQEGKRKAATPDSWSCGMWAVGDKGHEGGSNTGSEGHKMKNEIGSLQES